MRLWSLHPKYLDTKGLVALWKEALLAQAVLKGETIGYTQHPQLERFTRHRNPIAAISFYLKHIEKDADNRGYKFDKSKIDKINARPDKIAVADEQLMFEFSHLKSKLIERDALAYGELSGVNQPAPHPLFIVKRGSIANWEKF